MAAQPLLIEASWVPVGATVFCCDPGSEEPETGDDGKPLPPLRCLGGGVPRRPKLYSVDGGIVRLEGGGIMGHGMECKTEFWRPGTRFKPVQVFSLGSAPASTDFAVFLGGERPQFKDLFKDLPSVIAHDDPHDDEYVWVHKGPDRRFVSIGNTHWLREVPLPPEVQLVPITEVGAAKRPDRRH